MHGQRCELSLPTVWNTLKVSWEMNAMRNLSISRDSEHVLSPNPPAKRSLGHVQMVIKARLSQTYLPPSWVVSEFNLCLSETRYHHPSGTEWIHKNTAQQFSTGRCRTGKPSGVITPETEWQLRLSLYDSPKLIYSLGLSLPETKSLIDLYHISCMYLKKPQPNQKPHKKWCKMSETYIAPCV